MTLQFDDTNCEKLSSKETELLYILIANKNELVQRNVILEKIWGNRTTFRLKVWMYTSAGYEKLLKEDPAIEILNRLTVLVLSLSSMSELTH